MKCFDQRQPEIISTYQLFRGLVRHCEICSKSLSYIRNTVVLLNKVFLNSSAVLLNVISEKSVYSLKNIIILSGSVLLKELGIFGDPRKFRVNWGRSKKPPVNGSAHSRFWQTHKNILKEQPLLLKHCLFKRKTFFWQTKLENKNISLEEQSCVNCWRYNMKSRKIFALKWSAMKT
jgi:hypothetical protein